MVKVKLSTVRWVLRLGIIAVGALQGWAERNVVSPDGVSYLNLSDGWATGALSAGVNGYWSPLYPAVLGLARAVVNPSPENEAMLLHAVNLLVMVVSLVGFEMFLSELRAWRKERVSHSDQTEASDDPLWWLLMAYGLFAWGALELIGVGLSSPDMLGAAALYFAAAITLRLLRAPSAEWFAALGLVLGLGYLARGALLVIGALWAGLIVAGLRGRGALRLRLITPLVFVVVVLPLIAVLSLRSGRVNFGDVARINRGWYVNRYPFVWTGFPPGSGTPVHSPLIVNARPLILTYPGSVGSSYPVFDDPSYWNEGMTPQFEFTRLSQRISKGLRSYAKYLSPLILGLFLLSRLAKPRTVIIRELAAAAPLSIPMLVLLAGYATVVTQPRFSAAPAVILSLLTFDALRYAASPPPMRILVGVAAAVTMGSLAWKAADVAHQLRLVVSELSGAPASHDQFAIAAALSRSGLRRGDKVAFIGNALGSYWARLAGVRIAAEVHGDQGQAEYWAANDSSRSDADAKLFRVGARAIVTAGAGNAARTAGWQALPAQGYFVKWAPQKMTTVAQPTQRHVPMSP